MAGPSLSASLDSHPALEHSICRCNCSYPSVLNRSALKRRFTGASKHSSGSPVAFSKDHFHCQASRARKLLCSPKHYVGRCRIPARVKGIGWKEPTQKKSYAPGFLHVLANSKADDPLPSEMSLENALKLLEVKEGASFDEILRAKNAVLSRHSGDQELAIQVEAAYDLLLMRSLTQRRAGKVADNSILYADVKKAKSRLSSLGNIEGPQWIKDAIHKSSIAVETPSPSVIGTQSAVYAGLMVWNFASGLSSQPSLNPNADVPGLILAIGFGASLYFMRMQNVKLGKAAALTLGGLVAGAVLGGAVESWLRVDLIPVFGIGSPAVVVSEFVLISLWLSSLYLR